MNFKQDISGGSHIHNYNFTQQELDLETKVTCTFRTAPKLLAHIEKRAKAAGIPRSKYIETALIKYFKSEPKLKQLYAVLDDVIGKNF
jgi:predicted DNA binding CopG/RHH family protein